MNNSMRIRDFKIIKFLYELCKSFLSCSMNFPNHTVVFV